jgi:hypothetical protein
VFNPSSAATPCSNPGDTMLGCDCFTGTLASYRSETLASQPFPQQLVSLVKRAPGAPDRCVCLLSAPNIVGFGGGPPPGVPVLAVAHCVAASGVGTSVNADCGGAPADTYGAACGGCGGTIQCDGSCSVQTPANLGASCGSCGGTIQCDGTCSAPTPANFGSTCGSCGSSIGCDGSCFNLAPPNYGSSCGSCGGTIQCDGTCSVPTPAGVGKCCDFPACTTTVGCDGQCH